MQTQPSKRQLVNIINYDIYHKQVKDNIIIIIIITTTMNFPKYCMIVLNYRASGLLTYSPHDWQIVTLPEGRDSAHDVRWMFIWFCESRKNEGLEHQTIYTAIMTRVTLVRVQCEQILLHKRVRAMHELYVHLSPLLFLLTDDTESKLVVESKIQTFFSCT